MTRTPKALGMPWSGPVAPSWTLRRLKDVARVVNGFPFDSKAFDASGEHALVRIRDLNSSTTETRYSGPWVDAAAVDSGDVLIGMDGDFNVGTWLGGPALLNQRMCCVRAETPLMSRYLRYVLPTPLKVTNELTYFTTVKHLSSLDVERLTVPVPPDSQLASVVNFLDEQTARIDALIAEKERLAAAVEELTLSRLVSASLANNPVFGTYWEAVSKARVPDDWRLVPLRALFEESRVKNDEGSNENYLSLVSGVGVIPYADKGDLGNKKPDDLSKCKVVEAGDFVLNCMNFGIGAFGVSPQVGVCSPVYIVLRAKVDDAQLEFLRLLFSSQYFQKSVQSLGRGIMELRYAFGWDDIKNLNVPVPNAEVAAVVCRSLVQIQASGKALRKHVDEHIERLREYRSSLISAAVTGQLDLSTFKAAA